MAETRLNLPVPQCPHLERKWTRSEEQLSSSPKKGPSTEVLFSLTDGRSDKGGERPSQLHPTRKLWLSPARTAVVQVHQWETQAPPER